MFNLSIPTQFNLLVLQHICSWLDILIKIDQIHLFDSFKVVIQLTYWKNKQSDDVKEKLVDTCEFDYQVQWTVLVDRVGDGLVRELQLVGVDQTVLLCDYALAQLGVIADLVDGVWYNCVEVLIL